MLASANISLVLELVTSRGTGPERRRLLNLFAESNGWFPSDHLEDYFGTEEFAAGHLLVEHGLQNTAVITFLRSHRPLASLDRKSLRRLLGLSYNNLVDWHLFPDPNGIAVVSNRFREPQPRYFAMHRYPNSWRADFFDTLTADEGRPELSRLDQAIIDTVSFWKREMSFQLRRKVRNENISALMNSILFTRALEDMQVSRKREPGQLIVDHINRSKTLRVHDVFARCLSMLGVKSFPQGLQAEQPSLAVFDSLPRADLARLVHDFYECRFAPYDYDFGLISKQALSRIYEKYVAVLREPSNAQERLFDDWSEEVSNRDLGSYYTPQYVGRFFARFVMDSLPHRQFRAVRTLDPACGSGIFLREMLELQATPRPDIHPKAAAESAIDRLSGIDIDASAVRATELSLSLLHLSLTGELPSKIDLQVEDATQLFHSTPSLGGKYDVVISNPPFRAWDKLPKAMQKQYKLYLGDLATGRTDAALALLKVGIDAIKRGGMLLYVLPHSFLISDTAAPLRRLLSTTFDIHALVDLSAVDVFPGVSAYVVLLVAQKRADLSTPRPRPIIAQCRDFVGQALSDVIAHRERSTQFYEVFFGDQDDFERKRWQILPGPLGRVASRLESCPRLGEFCDVLEGAVSGNDEVFITRLPRWPKGESAVWRPFLHDREMLRYALPHHLALHMFNPVIMGKRLAESELKSKFPNTWEYLQRHKGALKSRSQVEKGKVKWWSPHRSPQAIFQRKIVCPHLMFAPRFSVDLTGDITVSRSPVIVLKKGHPPSPIDDDGLLLVITAALNTSLCAWQLATTSHAYAREYYMVEPKTLLDLRLPDLAAVDPKTLRDLVKLVTRRLKREFDPELDKEIEEVAIGLYGLSAVDLQAVASAQRE